MGKLEPSGGGKQLSRRQVLGTLAAVGAGVAAAAFFPHIEVQLPPTAKAPAAGPEPMQGEGFALVADASDPGRLIRWSSAGVVQAADSVSKPDSNHRSGPPYSVPPTKQWVMVIDLEKCDGCGECQVACDKYHHVPPHQEWIKIYQLRDNEESTPYWFARLCMQCDNPPCVKVCPVGATFKREDGIVLLDQDRCIGCRFCLAACPYSARYFDWAEPPQTPEEKAQPYDIEMNMPHRRGVAEKCLFCPKLTAQGKLPSCVDACPMNALYFGDRNEDAVTNHAGETERLSDLLREGAYRELEELGTSPRVYYLPPRRRKFPPPKDAGATGAAASPAREG